MKKTYRVLRKRFVPPRSVMLGAHKQLATGDTFQATESALLRRAVRDGDLELVEAAPAAQSDDQPRRKSK